jgi:hypothetical protein
MCYMKDKLMTGRHARILYILANVVFYFGLVGLFVANLNTPCSKSAVLGLVVILSSRGN